jgi:hypothetical protein
MTPLKFRCNDAAEIPLQRTPLKFRCNRRR